MQRIGKAWFAGGGVSLVMGLWASISGTTFVYERAYGIYAVSTFEDPLRYWLFTVMYFHGFLFCLLISLKAYYPKRLQDFMAFTMESQLSLGQVVFSLTITIFLFGSSFYIASALANA